MPSKNEKLGFRVKDEDDNIRAFLQPFRDANQLSDVIRILIIERTGDPLPPELEHIARKLGPPKTAVNEDAIDDLWDHQKFLEQQVQVVQQTLAMLQSSGPNTAALSELQSIVSQLARKVEYLSGRMDGLQTMRAAPPTAHVVPPPEDDDEPLELDIRRNTNDQSGSNFLASLNALQGE